MTEKIPYLCERGGALLFRRRIPARHHVTAGMREWKISLGNAGRPSPTTLIEVKLLTDATDDALALLDRGGRPQRDLLQSTLDTLHPQRVTAKIPKLSEAVDFYLAEKRLTELNKPEAMAVKQLTAFIGDVQLDAFTRQKVRDWIAELRSKRGQSEATIRRRLGSLSSIYAAAMDGDQNQLPNPFSRHRVSDRGTSHRLPFEQEHLAAIDAWLKTGAGNKPTGLIIRLLRATGCRPLEVGGLEATDLKLEGSVPYLAIRPNGLRTLKTSSSQRLVPLIGDGLAAALAAISSGRSGPLFPDTCHSTGSLSARLNKALRATGIPRTSALTAYSFRHTMAEALRTTDAPFDVQQAILGHAKTSITERYGARNVSLVRMERALQDALKPTKNIVAAGLANQN